MIRIIENLSKLTHKIVLQKSLERLTYYYFVTSIIYFEQVRDPDSAVVNAFMTVNRRPDHRVWAHPGFRICLCNLIWTRPFSEVRAFPQPPSCPGHVICGRIFVCQNKRVTQADRVDWNVNPESWFAVLSTNRHQL